MKTLLRSASLTAIGVIALLSVGCGENCPEETPPKGWSIASDGAEYVFVFPNGARSYFPRGTYKDAVCASWRQRRFKYTGEDRDGWPTVDR